MGTDKRARQKAGRQARLEALQAQQRKARVKKTSARVAAIVIVLVVIVAILVYTMGGSNSKNTSAASASTTVTTKHITASNSTTTSTLAVPRSTVALAAPPPTVPGAVLTAATTCPKADGSSVRTITFASTPPTCIDPAKTYTATVETNKGTFTIALDPKKAPATVNNFVVLARYHYYDGVVFHRIINNFALQGGDPTGSGSGGPGYKFNDELPGSAAEYKRGTLAMANAGPNTNGSQFFVVLGEGQLTAAYSIFGTVTSGLDTAVKGLEAVANPDSSKNGVPPLETVYMTKVTITET